ncbi:hypothetical protein [Rhizobium leguminosarum]|uniref:hypothetical protein n=1 Tax=Rhizobium leguminosarum TaxID=384 RepID=UPI001441065C|nr:hypothetical protein [Rhizobium leguminosarum]NKL08748.1 hypothetical protein [Rhizobium leguminosarum bv. viciae]NKL84208.1 hypothetical protein [Rhizobium leguminosarum bv. viciae]NKL94563.1 hypothetical protein [Rhizobium leguminosarum bv. viciae]NKM94600.1 hypothetical protein [Rhizobium leguminosarum bv. viciae]
MTIPFHVDRASVDRPVVYVGAFEAQRRQPTIAEGRLKDARCSRLVLDEGKVSSALSQSFAEGESKCNQVSRHER